MNGVRAAEVHVIWKCLRCNYLATEAELSVNAHCFDAVHRKDETKKLELTLYKGLYIGLQKDEVMI
jgi:hypothetical protein